MSTHMEHWNYSGLPPVERYNAAVDTANELLDALRALRINANRLCDRNLGGTYEEDCRRSIVLADAAIAKAGGK